MDKLRTVPFLKYLGLILFVFVFGHNQSLSAPTCQIITSVAYLKNGFKSGFGTSIDDLFDLREASLHPNTILYTNPFVLFTKEIESTILETTSKNLCHGDRANAPVFVDMTFVEITMIGSESEIDQARIELGSMNSSYADIQVDTKNRNVRAKFVWNPRRMLRDRLSLEGWHFDEKMPLTPFSSQPLHDLYFRTVTEVDKNRAEAAFRALDGSQHNDMVALVLASQNFMPKIQGHLPFNGIIRSINAESYPAYSKIIKSIIKSSFEFGVSPPLIHFANMNRLDIYLSYKSSYWHARVLPP